MTPRKEIRSTWTTIKAKWNGNDFYDHQSTVEERTLLMEIGCRSTGEPSLHFIGGPTGFEIYSVEALMDPEYGLEAEGRETLCICAGTTNSWPKCEVPAADVIAFLKETQP
jgi:hypothetical protein